MASHIYYEIAPAYRGKGCGREMLRLGFLEAKKIGLEEVIITCNEDNVASRKIIEANGGLFVSKISLSSTGKSFLKYKVSLT